MAQLIFHLIGEVNRSFSPPDYQCWSDETSIVFDVFERLIGYKYFGIIDHDEFLIPSRNRSLKQFMVRGDPTSATFIGTLTVSNYHACV